MKRRCLLVAAALALLCTPALGAATTFRFAFKGDLNALDPYTLNETFALGVLGNVMEGLTRRDRDLKIIPGLAVRWEIVEPTRWRFHLRRGVKFHDGSDFTADDVVFSAARARGEGSQVASRLPADCTVVKVDDHTVDFVLKTPNPILHYEWDTWYIFSKRWAEENGALKVQPATAAQLRPFALKANGTGPFVVVSHEPGRRTVFRPNGRWWDKAAHNLTEVVFTTIAPDAQRVEALLSGGVDWIDPVPAEHLRRVEGHPATRLLAAPELRTIMLMMDSFRDELKYGSVKGANPFKDARVRRALYQAIDIEAIRDEVMGGMATPSALLVSPLLYQRAGEFRRYPFDRAQAIRLLAEAGYAKGFEVGLDCPNDRYVDDEAICRRVAQMLSAIGVTVRLNIMPKARFFEKVGPAGGYDTSFYLFGWTPVSLDSWNVLANLAVCRNRDEKGARVNFRGYCDPRIDQLADQVLTEADSARRDTLIAEAYRIIHDSAGILPLHQQKLAWGVSRSVSLVQRADNQLLFHWIRKEAPP